MDVLFRSAAEVFGGATLGVILTGMGQDGLRGCEAVWKQVALCWPKTKPPAWFGACRVLSRAGLAEQVLPLDQIMPAVIRQVVRGRALASLA